MNVFSSKGFRKIGAVHGAQNKAFTLLEVLVGTVLLAILMVVFGQMINHVGTAWKNGEAQMSKSQDGRSICDFIARELQGALLPVLKSDTANLQFVVNPGDFSSAFRAQNAIFGDAIFWQAPLATDQTLGDVAEVGYFLKWDGPTTSNPRARLCRLFVNPVSSGSANSYFLIYNQPDHWLTQEVLDYATPANQSASYQGLFVENVVGFWTTCLGPDGTSITKAADGSLYSYNFDSRLGYISSNGTNAACALPAAVDVSFVLLDSQSAVRVTQTQRTAIESLVASSRNADAFVTAAFTDSRLNSIKKGLRPFSTRVYLRNSK